MTKEVATSGCGSCGSGPGTVGDTFVRSANPNYPTSPTEAEQLRFWKTKAVVTHANGTQTIAYINGKGAAILMVEQDSTGTEQWYTFNRYGENCRLELAASSAAVIGFDESKSDLLDRDAEGLYEYLADSTGLIEITEYHSATATAAIGGVAGQPSYRKIKEGETGTLIALELREYYTSASEPQELAQLTVYPDDSSLETAIVTSYSYTYHTGTDLLKQKATTLPAVPTSQNGSGVSDTIIEVYDDYGRLTWRKDERGVIEHQSYDAVTGQLAQRIEDVDTDLVTGEPIGWSTVSGFGLHAVSDYTYDARGRLTQVLGPPHEAVVGGSAVTVRHADWTTYHENSPFADDEVRHGDGYATGSDPSYSYTLVNPVSIAVNDKAERTVASIMTKRSSGSGKLSASDTFSQSDWVRWSTQTYADNNLLIAQRIYHNIPTSCQ